MFIKQKNLQCLNKGTVIQQWKYLKHVACVEDTESEAAVPVSHGEPSPSSPFVLSVAHGGQAALKAGELALTRWEGVATF